MADIKSIVEQLGSGDPQMLTHQFPLMSPTPMPGLIGQTGSIGAPAILKSNQLFDYSRLREVPNVPQEDIPRYIPPRGACAVFPVLAIA